MNLTTTVNSFPRTSASRRPVIFSAVASLDAMFEFPQKRLWTPCLVFRGSASRRPVILRPYENETMTIIYTGYTQN